jgi:hypothetical protein
MKILIAECSVFLGFHLCLKILKVDNNCKIVSIDYLKY